MASSSQRAPLVPVSKSAPPTAYEQNTAQRAIESNKHPSAFVGHLCPTAQQHDMLMKQHRRRPVAVRDNVWSIFTNRPPSFPQEPIAAVPFMDSGISPAYELVGGMERKRLVKARDAEMVTPSAEFALTIDKADVADRFQTTSRASQQHVRNLSASVGGVRSYRRTPQSMASTRSKIDFGGTHLECLLQDAEIACIARKPLVEVSVAPPQDVVLSSAPPIPVNKLRFVKRSKSELGEGFVPHSVDNRSSIDEQRAPLSAFNIKKSSWDQDAVIRRRERELEFASIKRIPRPSKPFEGTQVLSLR